jgi:hypothetical protein
MVEKIPDAVWEAFYDLIQSRAHDGSFARAYPSLCGDGEGITGTDEYALATAIRAHIPEIEDVFQNSKRYAVPPAPAIFDLLEFAYDKIASPSGSSRHKYFGAFHLHLQEFDVAGGRRSFQDEVNLILSRSGLGYELRQSGEVMRLGPPILREELVRVTFNTGDQNLDQMLEDARRTFLDSDPGVRGEALKKLWDAWERVKTLEKPDNKKASVQTLLDKAAPNAPRFRAMLEKEARGLTDAGNELMIRHSEKDKEQVNDVAEIDYLFHVAFALILLVLRKSDRLSGKKFSAHSK